MGVQNPTGGAIARTAARIFSPAESLSYRQIKDVTESEAFHFEGEFDNPSEYQIELASELCDIQFMTSRNGQTFTALWLNRKQPPKDKPEDVLFVSNGFVTDATQYDAKLRAYWIAKMNPDKHVIVMDQPSHGLADNYTKQQRLGLKKGSMEDSGAAMWDAFERFCTAAISKEFQAEKRGASLGSRQDLDIMNASLASGHPITKAVEFEIPGTEGKRRFDIHSSFHIYEGLRTSYYKNAWEEELLADFKTFVQTYSNVPIVTPVHVFPFGSFKDRTMARENLFNSVLGHGDGRQILQQLLEQEVKLVRIVGEVSRIDRYGNALLQHQEFRHLFGNKSSALWMIRGESHGMTGVLSRMRIIETLSQYALRNIDAAIQVDDPVEIYSRDVQSGLVPVLENRRIVPYKTVA